VILGADFFTPHILKLSGIENQEVLASACLVEHERVGEYFEDHPVTIWSYKLVDEVFSLDHVTRKSAMQEAMQSYRLSKGRSLANAFAGNCFLAMD